MYTKRTNFLTEMKIGMHLEKLKYCIEIVTFFCYQSVLRSEKLICLKMQICIERIRENAILMHLHAIVSYIRLYGGSGEHSNHKFLMIFLQC